MLLTMLPTVAIYDMRGAREECRTLLSSKKCMPFDTSYAILTRTRGSSEEMVA